MSRGAPVTIFDSRKALDVMSEASSPRATMAELTGEAVVTIVAGGSPYGARMRVAVFSAPHCTVTVNVALAAAVLSVARVPVAVNV